MEGLKCQSVSVRLLFSLLAASLISQLSAAELQRVRYNNPGLNVDLGVGLWAWPLPMDYDGDGDLDLVVSSGGLPYEGTYFFENPSDPSQDEPMPVFRPAVRIGDYRTNAQISHNEEFDPVITTPGTRHGDFKQRAFGAGQDIVLPVAEVHSSEGRIRANQWKFVDWEGDGDLDLVVGIGDWADYGWDDAFDEAGRWTNGPLHGYVYLALRNADGSFGTPRKLKAGGRDVDVYGMPSPSFADFDSDGDLDLICGEFLDGFTYFENVGTRSSPELGGGRRLTNRGEPIAMDLQMITPTAVDWDGDGDWDLLVGDEDGRVAFVENTGEVVDGMPVFNQPKYFQQEARYVKFGALVTPQGFDWDEDGDEDIVAGNTAGYIGWIENLGGFPPRFAAPRRLVADGEVIRIQAGPSGSIQGPCEAKWGYTTISVADWDGDGQADLLANSIWGRVIWYRNKGAPGSPALESARPVRVGWNGRPPKPTWNWWNPEAGELSTQWRTRPVATDWDGDGLMDLIMLDHEGYLAWFRRVRNRAELLLAPGRRIFRSMPVSAYDSRHRKLNEVPGLLRLNAGRAGKSGRRKIDIADWDGDGLPDLMANSTSVHWMRNEGTQDGLTILVDKGSLTQTKLAGHTTSPTTVDWNGDGKRELLIGAEDGFLYWQER